MVFHGRVSNGAIILPPDTHLPEGAEVEVRPVVELMPAKHAKTGAELAVIWARLPRLSPEEAESFARDIEEGRAALNRPPQAPAWP